MSALPIPRTAVLAAIVVAIITLVISLVGAFLSPKAFFTAYLVAYVFWWGVALGGLALGLFHALTGGAWGEAARPVFAASARTLPVLALLFVPFLLGLHTLYPWTRHGSDVPAAYLNTPAFVARAALYFVVWITLALPWTRGALMDRPRPRLAAGGLVLFAFSTSFAAIDWVMSLAPPWHSSSFGMMIALGQALSAIALAIVILAWTGPALPERTWHQLGNVLLALVLLWSYVAFTQYLTIWAADLPHEVFWYLARQGHGWEWLAGAVIAFHFAVPFLLLLSRAVKRTARLRTVALVLLIAHALNVDWLVVPSVLPTVGMATVGLQIVVFLAVGGVWMAVLLGGLRRQEAALAAEGGRA